MRSLIATVSFGVAALLAGNAFAQAKPGKMPPVQAEVATVYTLENGQQVRTAGHFYRNGKGQVREDSPLGAVITDLSAGTITILVASTKEARVITVPNEKRTPPARAGKPGPKVFEETRIAGRRISKARSQGPQGEKVELWTAPDLGLVVWNRTEAPGLSSTKEVRNISDTEPDPTLFEIPADYTIIRQEPPREPSAPETIPQRLPPPAAAKAPARKGR